MAEHIVVPVSKGEGYQAALKIYADLIEAGAEPYHLIVVTGPPEMLQDLANSPNPLNFSRKYRKGGGKLAGTLPFTCYRLEQHPRKGGRCKWFKVSGQYVQGTYERRYAEALDLRGVKWIAHKIKQIPWVDPAGKNRWYMPDFYLPDTDTYIEIKGFLRTGDKLKYDCVKAQHPALKLNFLWLSDIERLEQAK